LLEQTNALTFYRVHRLRIRNVL